MTSYEMRISDWSSDVCSSDLLDTPALRIAGVVKIADRHNRTGRGGERTAVINLRNQILEFGIIARNGEIAATHRTTLEADLIPGAVFVAEQHLRRTWREWIGQPRVGAAGARAETELGRSEAITHQLGSQRGIIRPI